MLCCPKSDSHVMESEDCLANIFARILCCNMILTKCSILYVMYTFDDM